ncbi:LAGLIDADG family homing endonuclease [Paenibacillus polymyxa]|uniref:LAGLIDADG family homing endonuclease n=1 Tax=Paenibacillus polymyxa TaxID=1406 RepID=UPI00287F8B3A|nr:LAGLIDADG family homing endonuclease [Paenibacillus polymyxa]
METGYTVADLKEIYDSGLIAKEVAKIANISSSLLLKWFRKSGYGTRSPRTQYIVNEDYFKIIDSEEKAYWMGFIWCDGYVGTRIRRGRAKESWFELSLNIFDKPHLEKLNSAVSSNYIIKEYSATSSKSKNEFKASLRIFNKKFCEVLIKEYDFVPQRTDIEKLKRKIPTSLAKHFIRGLIDANGSIVNFYDNGKNKEDVSVQLSSRSEELLQYVQDHFIEEGILNTYRKIHKSTNSECMYIIFRGLKQTNRILKYLYSDSNCYLDRKYKKYLDALKVYDRRELFFAKKLETAHTKVSI